VAAPARYSSRATGGGEGGARFSGGCRGGARKGGKRDEKGKRSTPNRASSGPIDSRSHHAPRGRGQIKAGELCEREAGRLLLKARRRASEGAPPVSRQPQLIRARRCLHPAQPHARPEKTERERERPFERKMYNTKGFFCLGGCALWGAARKRKEEGRRRPGEKKRGRGASEKGEKAPPKRPPSPPPNRSPSSLLS
jgi:hypothetical protein